MRWRFAAWSSLTLFHPFISRTLKLYQIISQFCMCWPPYCSYLFLSPEQGRKSVPGHFKRVSISVKASFSQHPKSTWNLFIYHCGIYLQLWPVNSSLISLLPCSVWAVWKQSLTHGPAVPAPCAQAQPLLPPGAVTTTRSDTAPGRAGAVLFLPEQTQSNLCTPQYKHDKHNTHSSGRSRRMKNPSGLRWHLDIDLRAPQKI